MAVYVDQLAAWGTSKTWRYTSSCHMYTDGDAEELHTIAQKIGLKRQWYQDKDVLPHYDLTGSKRVLAVQAGATSVDWRHMAEMIAAKRAQQKEG